MSVTAYCDYQDTVSGHGVHQHSIFLVSVTKIMNQEKLESDKTSASLFQDLCLGKVRLLPESIRNAPVMSCLVLYASAGFPVQHRNVHVVWNVTME